MPASQDILKNKLDLEYHFEARKAAIFLSLETITLLSFMSYMFAQHFARIAIGGGLIILIISLYFYSRTTRRMRAILAGIEAMQQHD